MRKRCSGNDMDNCRFWMGCKIYNDQFLLGEKEGGKRMANWNVLSWTLFWDFLPDQSEQTMRLTGKQLDDKPRCNRQSQESENYKGIRTAFIQVPWEIRKKKYGNYAGSIKWNRSKQYDAELLLQERNRKSGVRHYGFTFVIGKLNFSRMMIDICFCILGWVLISSFSHGSF